VQLQGEHKHSHVLLKQGNQNWASSRTIWNSLACVASSPFRPRSFAVIGKRKKKHHWCTSDNAVWIFLLFALVLLLYVSKHFLT
jgi:hypothetical protein